MDEKPQGRCITVGGVRFDLKLTLIIILSVLLPTINLYHHIVGGIWKGYYHSVLDNAQAYDQPILYLFIPLLVILLVFRESPAQYGFRVGKWKEGLVWIAVVCPLMLLILWFLVRHSDMQQYYSRIFYGKAASSSQFLAAAPRPAHPPHSHLYMLFISALVIVPWEFIWRGFYLFGLARVVGPGPAIFLQAVPFALLHLGKPEVEMISTIFGGAGFGFVAWRTQSFFYPMLIHYFILVATNLAASGALG